jgi:hypothetical protein
MRFFGLALTNQFYITYKHKSSICQEKPHIIQGIKLFPFSPFEKENTTIPPFEKGGLGGF